ncbi:pyridoxal phosphate-dependent decarboxylase family protein [Planctobacterium marinum]|uniref:pyridoxal phosphate-dependent decarboxylase family protein n=1 Tax=Planctobacterium marinum TaxID=1631968 RepID=UPI001E5B9856|nr:aminotransferase class I/II-fold pyridoxal phosphate-dependent enzyme [Planctobacterium marinum]MCC2608131.1 aminotransferase class I/II-fold pyridoxal phosphate-dependent enzyme [Planctobacterium marinum]
MINTMLNNTPNNTFCSPNNTEWQELISHFAQQSLHFLQNIEHFPVANLTPHLPETALPEQGLGSEVTAKLVESELIPQMSGSRGPRYWGFVTGGATPVATYADWLVAMLDQNVSKGGDSIATQVEQQAIKWLVALFDLPDSFTGLCTTGATASNFLAAVTARQYAGEQQQIDIAKQGMKHLDVEIFSACPHASMIKTLGLAGFGQDNVRYIKTLPDSEAMNPKDLERQLNNSQARSKIVISSAATVTGTSFDDLQTIAGLCQAHAAWLHVDAAFGIFARLIPAKKHLSDGLELADSITLDGHKWLNVPYDCGFFFTRHQRLLVESCHVAAPYLVQSTTTPDFMSLGIENSRRFRALPVWMTIKAYGQAGIRFWVEKNCRQAAILADYLDASNHWQLVHPCALNVVLFRPDEKHLASVSCSEILHQINRRGKVFFSPGQWQGQHIIRAALSNWQTEDADIAIAIQELNTVALQNT